MNTDNFFKIIDLKRIFFNFVAVFKINFKTKQKISVKRFALIFIHLNIIFFLLYSNLLFAQTKQKQVSKVVLDAGHGGHDPGAVGKKSKEKNIVLELALMTGKLIETHCPEVEVFYTRKTDVFLALETRANIANGKKADLFISIHCNASKRTEARGTEVYVMGMDKSGANFEIVQKENGVILFEDNYEERYEGIDPKSPEAYIIFNMFQSAFNDSSIRFASKAMDAFNKNLGLLNRGVKQGPFLVLWRTAMPSALVEVGFISNLEEEKILMSEQGKQKVAYAIYSAFVNYKSEIENSKLKVVSFQEAFGLKAKSEQEGKQEPEAQSSDTSIYYRVQLFIDLQLLSQNDERFKSIENVEHYFENGYYKYVVGKYPKIDAALELRKNMVEKGFKDAFVVAFEGSKRIDVSKAKSITE